MKYADYTQAVNGTNNTSVMTPLRVKQAIQANSGGSGTSDYTALENKPKINGVTLEGDKSSSDLGISVPSVDEETIIKSPNLTAIGVKESSGNVDHFLTLTLSEYNAIENKDPNTFYNITDDTDPSAIPTKTSDLVNDSGFITSSYHDNTKVDKDSIARVNNVVSKNKININGYVAQQYSTRISVKNNTARVTCLGDGQNMYSCIKIENISELLGKTCTFKVTATSSSSNVPMARIYFGTNNAPETKWTNFDLYGGTSNTQITSTFPANMPSGCDGAYVLLYGNRNGTGFSVGAYVDYTDIQLEEGSVATDYAPYLNLEEAMQENQVYSTNEIRVGTWINGKPLYRKTYVETLSSQIEDNGSNTQHFIHPGITNVDDVVSMTGTIDNYQLPYIFKDTNTSINYYNKNNNVIVLNIYKTYWTAGTKIKLTMEYTKTTD